MTLKRIFKTKVERSTNRYTTPRNNEDAGRLTLDRIVLPQIEIITGKFYFSQALTKLNAREFLRLFSHKTLLRKKQTAQLNA